MSPNQEPQIFTYAKFDLQSLCRQASALRQSIVCSCDPDERPTTGGFNWAIFLFFEDGVRWVFRSRYPRSFMPMEMGMKLLSSETATLRYIRAYSDILVLEVYDYCASSDNKIGIPYIFMSEASVRPLSNAWKPAGCSLPDLKTAKKVKVPSQLGAITWKLLRLRFDKIGLLFEENQPFEKLNRLLSFYSISDYNLFATVWKIRYSPEQDLGQYFLQQRRLPQYNQLYLEYQQEDRPLWKIERDEKDYFRNKDFRKAIARKLALISEWKT
ncbi:hypothetical protein N7472_007421 [Penicillium cf. griseofulvum]|uniref:Uncharacterized protein n=1 Tax=Penicillium cf. griseofulvum TaxID=2972120 RepID=A0A9W9M5V7_9EURO|nr:hypothetical protein N7472_007421 [Penicillium cf. griseofulvum]KAJ5451964.1 hypothetical protein N7445_000147 [Penicillium cf. griseofulvum]